MTILPNPRNAHRNRFQNVKGEKSAGENKDKRENRKSIKDKAGEKLRLEHADVDQMAWWRSKANEESRKSLMPR